MKIKCPQCGNGKARRTCRRVGDNEICSGCCATLRDADCGECVHYGSALRYEENRSLSSLGKNGTHFLMELNEEVQNRVNSILTRAQQGDKQASLQTLKELLVEHPRHPDIPYGIAMIHVLNKDYEESMSWFDRSILIDPYCVDTYFNKAITCLKLGDLLTYVRGLQKVVSLGPQDDEVVRRARSLIQEASERISRTEGISLEVYLRASEIFNDAFGMLECGEWMIALKGFRNAIKLNEKNPPSHGNIGLCLAMLGRKTEALAALDRALEIDPRYEPARANRIAFESMIEGMPPKNSQFETINFAAENSKGNAVSANLPYHPQ